MKCPFCRSENDRVIDSRSGQEGFVIRRRRECLACKKRYTTYERMEEPTVKVVKKDGSRVPFQREKIKRGLEKACWKRPLSDEQLDGIILEIEEDISSQLAPEIESQELGAMVMDHLRDLDQVAYVRFASVYRDFTAAEDFMREVAPMLAERKNIAGSTAPQDSADDRDEVALSLKR